MKAFFRKLSQTCSQAVGTPAAFLLALFATIVWAASGKHYHYSDSWQLVINTGTSVATFLIVFLIQNTQNRDYRVMQMKLDELIRALQAARTHLVQMEELDDAELEALQKEFQAFRDNANSKLDQIQRSQNSRKQPESPREPRTP
jgi:low affinity Fe/Cu permease